MRIFWSLALLLQFFFLYSLFTSTVSNCFPFIHPKKCHEDDSDALLQFKEGFVISKYASYDPFSYPKTTTWMPSTDCCSWDGIECDELTGHVIGIDLSSSQLYGSVDTNSSLFRLVHLQRLDLADNDFNHSQISPKIGELTKLRNLNLSQTGETTFSGEIPPEVSQLSNLVSLDLRSHMESFPINPINLMRLKVSTLRSLIQNSTRLEVLVLGCVNISSFVPDILANLTSLQKLSLTYCELYGEFPVEIFHLPNLEVLSLAFNPNLRGMLPNFPTSAPIRKLILKGTSFYGTLPTSMGSLNSLRMMSVPDCNFSGSLPSSLGNLTKLTHLDLGNNKFNIEIIPSWIENLTNLAYLSLEENNLHGEIPHFLFRLENLKGVSLRNNLLEGQLDLDMFLKLKKLTFLALSSNKLSVLTQKSSSNKSLSQIQVLALASSNLVELPLFVRDLDELLCLNMSYNSIRSLPSWMWRKKSLQSLSVSHNLLTGEISPLICNLKSLVRLDLSYNNLSGTIPSCLGSFSPSLKILMLQGNKLSGLIPQTYFIGSALKMIDFSNNNLQGQLPRSLINCSMLEYLDVRHNQINDSFPFWLGDLPDLKVIALCYNKFYGDIRCPRRCTFPKLHIIDLSHNEFSGNLPLEMVHSWISMKASKKSQLQYEQWILQFQQEGKQRWYEYNAYSFTMSIKGAVIVYERLQQFYSMIAIDISSNRISGNIPDAIGYLEGLVSLNLSNNMLTGSIPSSFGKLSNLETLDLSLNNLSGKIPQQLTELTFLEVFNVSFNKLSGPIPESTQLSTFEANSFEGNQGLCGIQVSKKCEDHAGSPLSTFDVDQDSGSLEFDWKIVFIGYGGGLVVGLALGSTLSLNNLG